MRACVRACVCACVRACVRACRYVLLRHFRSRLILTSDSQRGLKPYICRIRNSRESLLSLSHCSRAYGEKGICLLHCILLV